ncbi:MAG: GNAT family N-acetyltransferase [Candidatus Obscuribacterales bacterium]|nr:GNAT family N-acetyltransferase [Candidatus Obscuribacterales bacterium]
MQIRAANRQDEPILRTIIFQALEEHGLKADLEGRDRDLRNVEYNYFWFDGLCLVAERDGQLIGVLAARKSEKDDNVLELLRLAVTPGARQRGVAKALVKTMLFFAANMEYKLVKFAFPAGQESFIPEEIMTKLGFQKDSDGSWIISGIRLDK